MIIETSNTLTSQLRITQAIYYQTSIKYNFYQHQSTKHKMIRPRRAHHPTILPRRADPPRKTDILSDKMTKGMSKKRFQPKNWQKEGLRHGK